LYMGSLGFAVVLRYLQGHGGLWSGKTLGDNSSVPLAGKLDRRKLGRD
jgi:hypothetical protein